jgi:hypothetical protein
MRFAHRPAHRRRTTARAALAALWSCFLAAAAVAEPRVEHSDGARCQTDALEQWYCAANPEGSAVLDKLGRVVCAPGACVKQETPDEEEWLCSTTPGGRAEAAPAGPRCDGECRTPEATACKKL